MTGRSAVGEGVEPVGPTELAAAVPAADGRAFATNGATPPDEGDEPGAAPPSLFERMRRPQTLISFAIAAAIIVFFFTQLDIHPVNVWRIVRETNVPLYLLAFVPFYLGFILRAERWRAMLARAGVDAAHGYPVPRTPGLIEIYLLSWFANCVVPAKLGDAYRSYLLKRESRAPFSTSFGTILAERLTDLVVLVGLMIAMGVVVFGSRLPGEARSGFIGGAALVALGLVGLAAMWWTRDALLRRIPHRFRDQYERLHDGVFAALRRPERFLGISVIVWLGEGLRVYLVCLALDAEVSLSSAVFVALLGSLLTALPFTPAGLGIVEASLITVLTYLDVQQDLAASVVLLDRVIGYWSIVAVGLVLYVRRVRRELALEVGAPSVEAAR